MKKLLLALGAAACAISTSIAQTPPTTAPSPGEIVTAAPASDWTTIAASDLLVMDLAPGPRGPRRVVIQLMPAPFSQGWIGNIRKLAAAKWWDGTSVNRVQDNYVVQWGDATEKKALPEGLAVVPGVDYVVMSPKITDFWARIGRKGVRSTVTSVVRRADDPAPATIADPYAQYAAFVASFPLALDVSIGSEDRVVPSGKTFTFAVGVPERAWPVHCYAMVGVGRNLSPDTGSGAELYTVIGHAPRHLDRNIALVGRVIEGIEHLSSLPRGTGTLGFYETEAERVPILSVRIGAEASDLAAYEYLSTESESFARYADARANRRDPFFIRPAGGADICNIPVPVRRVAAK